MSKADRIASKKAHIEAQIRGFQAGEVEVARVGGGPDKVAHSTQIGWHRDRLALLDWAEKASDAAVAARIAKLEAGLSPEALACKYGVVQGFPAESFQAISLIELLELVLGTHPAAAGK